MLKNKATKKGKQKTKGKRLLVFVTTRGKSKKEDKKNSSTTVKRTNFQSCSNIVPQPPDLD